MQNAPATKEEVKNTIALFDKHNQNMYNALMYHRTHKGEMITLYRYEYLKDFLLDDNPYISVKKSTQGGYTEVLEIMAITKAIAGRGVFYVLPSDRLVSRFVKNRIDKSIIMTKHYRNLISESGKKRSESVSLKHIGKGVIAFTPSNSTSAFTEFPADDIIIDELDECDQANIAMAEERLSASRDPRIIKIGNPTVLNFGIDAEFINSDQKEWHIKCNCGEWIKPDFFTHVVKEIEKGEYVILDDDWTEESKKDINMICHKCGKPFDKFGEGKWVSQAESSKSGYHVSKLFSTNMRMSRIVEKFNEGLKDDTKLQRFYNGDLGLAYTAKGSKLDYELLNDCKGQYVMPNNSPGPCIFGADVGTVIHVKIGELLPDKRLRVVFIGTVDSEQDVINLCKQYKVKVGCIDAMPEKRMVKKIVSAVRGMFMVYYGKTVKVEKVDVDNKIITVDRTASLDGVREAILSQSIILPMNADKIIPLRPDGISEYYYEMCTSTRIFNEKTQTYSWTEGSNPDHYFHATNYMLLARKLLMQVL